ncbi:hypothetical protein BKA61DRAFT_695542 [Leptodontidium sp. MPI-SDFR-AT-0119]|nr:hypothetical protein BKA61DRAFT_695542 [Leptodontidium sp. MPI-SDFR-AT-0119]
MRAQTMSTILALIFTYLTFALLIQASPLLSGRDIAGVLSADTVSGTSISNAGYNCSPVGTYDCGGPGNTTIVRPVTTSTASHTATEKHPTRLCTSGTSVMGIKFERWGVS